MTPSGASVAEVRRPGREKKGSLQPTIRGLATSIYLRKEGTDVNNLKSEACATGSTALYTVSSAW